MITEQVAKGAATDALGSKSEILRATGLNPVTDRKFNGLSAAQLGRELGHAIKFANKSKDLWRERRGSNPRPSA